MAAARTLAGRLVTRTARRSPPRPPCHPPVPHAGASRRGRPRRAGPHRRRIESSGRSVARLQPATWTSPAIPGAIPTWPAPRFRSLTRAYIAMRALGDPDAVPSATSVCGGRWNASASRPTPAAWPGAPKPGVPGAPTPPFSSGHPRASTAPPPEPPLPSANLNRWGPRHDLRRRDPADPAGRLHSVRRTGDRRGRRFTADLDRLRERLGETVRRSAPAASSAGSRRPPRLLRRGRRHRDGTSGVGRGDTTMRRLWGELRRIPAGEVRSYAQLGGGGASLGRREPPCRDPIALMVPCHRVVWRRRLSGGLRLGH